MSHNRQLLGGRTEAFPNESISALDTFLGNPVDTISEQISLLTGPAQDSQGNLVSCETTKG